MVDVAGAIELDHNGGALVIVDNTFLTPYLIQPLALGADIVIHSATKYMMGHGNGMKVAEFLHDHPMVKRVHYPGLSNDPGYEVAKKQEKGFGGMMGIELSGDKKLSSLEIVKQKTSLGDVSSLIVTGFIEKERRGIPANFYRMSVGIGQSLTQHLSESE